MRNINNMKKKDILKIINDTYNFSCYFKNNYGMLLEKYYGIELRKHFVIKYGNDITQSTIINFYYGLDNINKRIFYSICKDYNNTNIEIGLNFVYYLYSILGPIGISNTLNKPLELLKEKYCLKGTYDTIYEEFVDRLEDQDKLKLYYKFYEFYDLYEKVYGTKYNINYKY